MKTYNLTYIRSTEAKNIKQAKIQFKDMLEDLTGTDILESAEIELGLNSTVPFLWGKDYR